MKRQNKVLVIGAKGLSNSGDDLAVHCCDWSKIKSISNIRDYDTLILNLLSINDSRSRAAIDWSVFASIFRFSSTMDILLNGGVIIILGDPRFDIDLATAATSKEKRPAEIPFLQWTGINYQWDDSPGDTVVFNDDWDHRKYENYATSLKKWRYSLRHCFLNR